MNILTSQNEMLLVLNCQIEKKLWIIGLYFTAYELNSEKKYISQINMLKLKASSFKRYCLV